MYLFKQKGDKELGPGVDQNNSDKNITNSNLDSSSTVRKNIENTSVKKISTMRARVYYNN